MAITILADSACDLPLSFYKENNVSLIPLQVHLDGETYEDLLTINSHEVYQAMLEGKAPKTSQASPEYFIELFTQFAKEKKQGIYIAFSSELSGTYQTAVMILNQVKEEYPDLDIEIVNTKCASMGVGLIVKIAADLAANGATKEEILAAIEFQTRHMEHLFTVDNLEYLARGGRISKTSALVGGLLNIKPLLHVEDGKLVPLEKIRGKKKLIKRVIELMHERGKNLTTQTIAISHGDDEATALEWKEAIQNEFGTTDFMIHTIGSVIGAHAGPGTIALFFLNDTPEKS
ncbi:MULTISPECIES: DegV family protein [unclassified Bacillus (in: firmicutes)]|jgi:DegV family protein with EDD domain|uniref:DegV family protein n=1 Tax=unclassified Bacillus (in: firmicutes) TaxID=185979 RepID=UPI001BEA09D4|nr:MULTISPECIES: DegV family protein [unclassified Bacillus (in: firmicutes)]MBT2614562.1 DegV family protein [Bacillus sp. ISL-78]MBT2632140.1 DegV family protein [Bacillus sp. ISL-101]MBT2715542.1 DegV family protein [Bacillus sp. ISL-57]